jgi:hypothetical protein
MMSGLIIFTYRALAFGYEIQPEVVCNSLTIPGPIVARSQRVEGRDYPPPASLQIVRRSARCV